MLLGGFLDFIKSYVEINRRVYGGKNKIVIKRFFLKLIWNLGIVYGLYGILVFGRLR